MLLMLFRGVQADPPPGETCQCPLLPLIMCGIGMSYPVEADDAWLHIARV